MLEEVLPEQGSETPVVEFDADKAGLENLREAYKGLKTDVTTYKSSHELVNNLFGDSETAKLAGQVYNTLSGNEFDVKTFLGELEKVSPARAKALVDNLSSSQAEQVAQQKVKEIFGGDVQPEEIELFKKWKSSGYMVENTEDLPDAFRYDAEGNLLSDEQQEHYRKQFALLKDMQKRLESQVGSKENEAKTLAEQKRQEAIRDSITDFDNQRLSIVNSDLTKFGLAPTQSDTPEKLAEKNFVREFILGGIVRAFSTNQKGMEYYNSAISHVQNQEPLLAKRYEPLIEKGIVEVLRHPVISKMLSVLTPDSPPQARQEISNSGGALPPKQENLSMQDRINNLFATGKIRN